MGGHWGGFIIETADLKQLIKAVTGNALIAQLYTGEKASDARSDAEER